MRALPSSGPSTADAATPFPRFRVTCRGCWRGPRTESGERTDRLMLLLLVEHNETLGAVIHRSERERAEAATFNYRMWLTAPLRRPLPTVTQRLDPQAGFDFVKRHQARFPVRTMCRVLGLSTSSTTPGSFGRPRRVRWPAPRCSSHP